jgi:hypothetical protein
VASCVDDFDLAGSDRETDPVEERLRTKFDVKRTVDDAPFVCMQRVAHAVTGAVTIHQQRYTEELLVEMGMTQAKLVREPSGQCVDLQRDTPGDTALDLAVPCAQVVGKLMFLAGCTRLDIMQPVAALARYLMRPRERHWRAAKRTAALPVRHCSARPVVPRSAVEGSRLQHIRGVIRNLSAHSFLVCKVCLYRYGLYRYDWKVAVLWHVVAIVFYRTKGMYDCAQTVPRRTVWRRPAMLQPRA